LWFWCGGTAQLEYIKRPLLAVFKKIYLT
jgi:hypothetical protein